MRSHALSTLDYERADLRARLASLSLEVKLLRLAHALSRTSFALKTDDDEDEGPDDDDGPNSSHLLRLAGDRDPPQLPGNRPPSSALRTQALKAAARELAEAIADGRAETWWQQLAERANWMREKAAEIFSYLDDPKPLQELNRLVDEPSARYQIHHIVESASALQSGYNRAEVDSPTNLVRVPTLKHYEITSWYATPNPDFNELSPREYLRDKPWYVRREIGLQALRDAGVLDDQN